MPNTHLSLALRGKISCLTRKCDIATPVIILAPICCMVPVWSWKLKVISFKKIVTIKILRLVWSCKWVNIESLVVLCLSATSSQFTVHPVSVNSHGAHVPICVYVFMLILLPQMPLKTEVLGWTAHSSQVERNECVTVWNQSHYLTVALHF